MNNSSSLHDFIIQIPLLQEEVEKDNESCFPQIPILNQCHSHINPSSPRLSLPSFPLRKYAKSMGSDLNLNNPDIKSFKESYIRNHLAAMGLDLQICTMILSTLDYENQSLDHVIEIITDKYYAEEAKMIDPFLITHPSGKTSDLRLSFQFAEIPTGETIVFRGKIKVCNICYEKKYQSEFKTIPNTDHSFCGACIIAYLNQSIHSNRILQIKCPDDCPYELTEEDLQFLLKDDHLFLKYKKFKKILELSMQPNVRWCVRPGCDNHMEGDPTKKRLVCDKCGQDVCFACKNEWHEGRTCEQAMNQEFKRYMERVVVKECPSCHNGIEKIDGCNHMTCGKCRFEFCWLCGGKYSVRHFDWYNLFGCPGMQYSRLDRKGRCRIFMEKLCRILWTIILVPITLALAIALVPLGLVLGSLFGPFVFYYDKVQPRWNFPDVMKLILVFFLCVVFMPLTMALLIFPGSCILLYLKCKGDL